MQLNAFKGILAAILLVSALLGVFMLFNSGGSNAGFFSLAAGSQGNESRMLSFEEKKGIALRLLEENPELKARYDSFGSEAVDALLEDLNAKDFESEEEIKARAIEFAPNTQEEIEKINEEWNAENESLGLAPISSTETIAVNGISYSEEQLAGMTEEELNNVLAQAEEPQE